MLIKLFGYNCLINGSVQVSFDLGVRVMKKLRH